MSSFWPKTFDLTDIASPSQILLTAEKEWQIESGGQLKLLFQTVVTSEGFQVIHAYASHVLSGRSTKLFSVYHRSLAAYPVNIKIDEEDIPTQLQKEYIKINFQPFHRVPEPHEEIIENKWVSDSPAEFRRKLSDAFSASTIRAKLINLIAGSDVASVDETEVIEPIVGSDA